MAQSTDPVSNHLLQLGDLIQVTISKLVQSRQSAERVPSNGTGDVRNASGAATDLADWEAFNAQRTLLAASGTLTELVSKPENRLLEVSSQYFEARALHIAADARIPDLLAESAGGVSIDVLSAKVGIESRKLCKSLQGSQFELCAWLAKPSPPLNGFFIACTLHSALHLHPHAQAADLFPAPRAPCSSPLALSVFYPHLPRGRIRRLRQ